jgi:hypothetical protein
VKTANFLDFCKLPITFEASGIKPNDLEVAIPRHRSQPHCIALHLRVDVSDARCYEKRSYVPCRRPGGQKSSQRAVPRQQRALQSSDYHLRVVINGARRGGIEQTLTYLVDPVAKITTKRHSEPSSLPPNVLIAICVALLAVLDAAG